MVNICPETAAPIPHPFYLDARGVNRPTGPEKHPYYSEFAAGSGVVPVARRIGGRTVPALLICRYADVREVLRRQDVFSRAAAAPADEVDLSGTMLGMDGPRHARVRGVVAHSFTKRAVAGLRDQVTAAAEAQFAALRARDGRGDLLWDFAVPFTLHTICDLLGMPEKDRMAFRGWSEMFLATGEVDQAEVARSATLMGAYLWEQLESRRHHPVGDLLTRIAAGAADQPADVQVKLPIALVLGGWESTANSIATFVYVLRTRAYQDHPTAWDYLVEHPEKVDGAVTELERLHSTTNGDDMPRRVLADVVLPSGARLREGQVVIPSHDAANRDPRVFPDPDRMDFDRSPNPHLSFGYGPHHCVGAHLGAMETRVALRLLLRELPGLRIAVPRAEVRWKAGNPILGPQELPVRW